MSEEFRPDVVAGKYDPHLFDPTGQNLAINEIFYSLQGEGRNTGQATVFVRLAKCNLACKFCDTEFETFQYMHVEQVVMAIKGLLSKHATRRHPIWVDFTGGEPMLQNLTPLLHLMEDDPVLGEYAMTAVETSGSVSAQWLQQIDWLTCSPKVPLSKLAIDPSIVDEFKWIVNAAFLAQYEKHPEQFFGGVGKSYNYLQPESNHPKWIAAATKIIQADPRYWLSLQTHKFANNP